MCCTGVEAGKKAAGEVLALQKRVLTVLNEARHVISLFTFVYYLSYIIYLQILICAQ